ncbi:MAG: hypothetical protein WAU69_00710 [Solirubrobacteraceae bacterium]
MRAVSEGLAGDTGDEGRVDQIGGRRPGDELDELVDHESQLA